MTLFNHTWSTVSRITVCKFWIKSHCISVQYKLYLNSNIQSLASSDDFNIDFTATNDSAGAEFGHIVDPGTAQSMLNTLSSISLMAGEPGTLVYEVLDEA